APPPRTGPKLHPREGGDPYTAASHEDTSSDRSRPCGPSLSASVTSQLSLHPSINTRVAVTATLFVASPKRRWCLSAKPVFRLPAGRSRGCDRGGDASVQHSCTGGASRPAKRRFAGGGAAHGGGDRDRTDDLLLAKQALSQ